MATKKSIWIMIGLLPGHCCPILNETHESSKASFLTSTGNHIW